VELRGGTLRQAQGKILLVEIKEFYFIGQAGILIADFADLRGFLGGTEGIEKIRELVDWGRGQRLFRLIRLGMWGNLGGEVEDCWVETAARAGP